MKTLQNILLFGTLFLLIACNAGKNQTNVELIQAMMDQESIKAQDWDPKQPGKTMMLTPPKGTIARGKAPYPYHLNPKLAEKNLKNPYAGQMGPEIIEVGQEHYKIYCSVCHGARGAGDGTVAAKMSIKPPAMTSDRIRNLNDGRIFHAMIDGYGVMGSYANQIRDPKVRWSIVNYVRILQKK